MKTLNKILFLFFLSHLLTSFLSGIRAAELKTANNSNLKVNTLLSSNLQNQVGSSNVLAVMKGLLGKDKKKKNKSKFRSNKLIQGTKVEKPKSVEVIDKNKILTEFENLKVFAQDWMRISSPSFRDTNKFPSILLHDYSEKNINIDTANFRINEAFSANSQNANLPPEDLFFWFTVNDKNIYYTDTKTSLVVRGNLPLKKLVGVAKERKQNSTCFELSDSDNNKWKLCAQDQQLRHKWICYLNTVLGIDDFECQAKASDANIVVEDTNVTDPVILIPLPSKTCNEKWTYANNGNEWECDCQDGKTQSPIDIDTSTTFNSPVKPVFKYEEFKPDDNDKFVFEDGAIKVKSNKLGRVVTLDGNSFVATEIVFHTPSQHRINGKFYDMEMEIIHVGEFPDVITEHLVLSIFFQAKAGVYNKFLDDLDFFNLPGPTSRNKKFKTKINLNKVFYDITQADYPRWEEFSFFTYEGSLSAPPCTEKTIVYVKKDPIYLGNTTLQLFREGLKRPDTIDDAGNISINNSEPTNIRKTQPINGRRIYYYNHAEPALEIGDLATQEASSKTVGHYEKVQKKMINYFHVTGPNPSEVPGSFVVSENEAKGIA